MESLHISRHHFSLSASRHLFQAQIPHRPPRPYIRAVAVTISSADESPSTARERRQVRKEKRESKPAYNWREEVEDRLIKKPKKRYASWTEELNLDNLAVLGSQWWVVRVSGEDTAERMTRSMARNFPSSDF